MSLDVHINLLQKIYHLRKLCTTQLGLSFWLKAVDAKAKTIQKQNITAWWMVWRLIWKVLTC